MMKTCPWAGSWPAATSLARPRTPDDNPYSEAHFKTVKYHPTFPDRFGCLLGARSWGQRLFHWYNYEHHHTGLGLMTPAAVHCGQAPALFPGRRQVLAAAYATHAERIVRGVPQPPALPTECGSTCQVRPRTCGATLPSYTKLPPPVSKTH
jgi:hypothetical protein